MRSPMTSWFAYFIICGLLAYQAFGSTLRGAEPDAEPSVAAEVSPSSNVPAILAEQPPADPTPVRLVAHNEPAAAASTPPVIKAAGQEEQLSDAERISRLQRSLQAGENRLAELKDSLTNPKSEYGIAEADFKDLDAQLAKKRAEVEQAKNSGTSDDVERLENELAELEKKRSLAKDRFDLAIQERKALQENIATLEQKLQKDREVLDKLNGTAQATPAPPMPDAGSPSQPSPIPAEASSPAGPPPAEQPPAVPRPDSPPTPLVESPLTSSPPGLLPTLLPDAAGPPVIQPGTPTKPRAPSKELIAATEAAEKSAAAAEEAEGNARSISERIEILRRSIDAERKLWNTSRRKVDIAEEALRNLNKELCDKFASGESTLGFEAHIDEAAQRLRDARNESRRVATHVDELQSELGELQAEQIAALQEAEQKRTAADKAQQIVAELNNPFTFRNVLQWLLDHGPRAVAIVLAMGLLMWLSRSGEARLIRLMSSRGRRGSREERENRARTLASVFHNAANLLITGGGLVMLLDEFGIPIGLLAGGAAVVGLAVAFGAQSLIKDYFTGFILLLEQQYLINDVVKIGDISGQVERITLRMTLLRDLEGKVHFIPHGQIQTVTNMTHGWSRAVLEVAVAYKEDVDHVIDVLMQLGGEMRNDPVFGPLILEDPTMLGVNSLSDSAVVIKFFIKTRPLQQWNVKRELLRRIKNKFDELGIEIPFPHRTVYHRDASIENESLHGIPAQQRKKGAA